MHIYEATVGYQGGEFKSKIDAVTTFNSDLRKMLKELDVRAGVYGCL